MTFLSLLLAEDLKNNKIKCCTKIKLEKYCGIEIV